MVTVLDSQTYNIETITFALFKVFSKNNSLRILALLNSFFFFLSHICALMFNHKVVE